CPCSCWPITWRCSTAATSTGRGTSRSPSPWNESVGRIARLLTAAAGAVPLVGSAAGRAVACVCLPATAQQIVHGADAIVAGRIQSEIPRGAPRTRSIVKVQGVYRGTVPATIFVDAALGSGGGSDCAVLYPVG